MGENISDYYKCIAPNGAKNCLLKTICEISLILLIRDSNLTNIMKSFKSGESRFRQCERTTGIIYKKGLPPYYPFLNAIPVDVHNLQGLFIRRDCRRIILS